MSPLILIVIALLAVFPVIAVLVRNGFRHGDLQSDLGVSARVQTVAGRPGQALRPGGWVAVTISNPAPGTALVGLQITRARRGERLMPVADRRTGGRRSRVSVTDQVVGAVPGGAQERFWLWADSDPRRLCLLAAVGTEGRLRLHRLPLAGLPTGDVGATGVTTDRPPAPMAS